MQADILQKISAHKLQEVAAEKLHCSIEEMQQRSLQAGTARDFIAALQKKIQHNQAAIIAEIKKASPSKGIIRADFDPTAIAKTYAQHGAACLSVLTEQEFFQGNNDYLIQARAACDLPVLRKDFILDTYQIYQARSIGADCILLIAAILNDEQLQEFTALAQKLNMAVLVEVHDTEELQRALKLNTLLLGINNRNLRTFKTTLNTTLELLEFIPTDKIIISESGISTPADIALLWENNVKSFLIGEAFMRETDPGVALKKLCG